MAWDQEAPFKIPITVSWGDCDPAGIIYTPRVFDYATEAIEAWFRDVLVVTWFDLNWKRNMGTPTVHAQCDYLRPLEPDMKIGVEVRIEKVGRTAVTFLINGRDGDGHHYFRAKFVNCFIVRPDPGENTGIQSMEIPAPFREKMLDYQQACGDD